VAAAWQLLDRQLTAGRFPGYAAAIRHGDEVSIRVGGTLGLDDPRPVRPDTQFRIASLTKVVAGVLTLNLVADGLLGLDDPVGRWLPELAEPPHCRWCTNPAAPGSTTAEPTCSARCWPGPPAGRSARCWPSG